jgi:phosphohistidine phosphatase SixA
MRSITPAGVCLLFILIGIVAVVPGVRAQGLSGSVLVNALQHGGYVIVMRHASSPRDVPDARTVQPDNTARERQLDQAGRDSARAMGEALQRLRIPVSEVFTSPTYRARETVRLLGFTTPTLVEELGDGGQSMRGASSPQALWLQRIVNTITAGNWLVVTHQPNIVAAFPQLSNVADGESVVFRREAGTASVVARVKIDDWPRLP